MFGNFASSALDASGVEYFKLPHPSARNRMNNDPAIIDEKLVNCAKYLIDRAKYMEAHTSVVLPSHPASQI